MANKGTISAIGSDPLAGTKACALGTILGIVGGAAAIALGALVRVPFGEVPLTLQTLAVLLCGYMMRPGAAIGAALLYLCMGIPAALGYSVPAFFATSAGLFGITGGYLVGFLVAAPLVAVMSGGVRGSRMRQLAAGFAGTVVIFAFGVVGLMVSGRSLGHAIGVGVVPFVIPACIKLGLAFSAVRLVTMMTGPKAFLIR